MKKLFAKLLLCCCMPLLWASFAYGQKDGVASFSAADAHEFDTVNLPNLVPSFNFPVISKNAGVLSGKIVYESPQACHQITSTSASCQTLANNTSVALYSVKEPMFDMQPVWTVSVNGNCTLYTVTALTGLDQVSFYQLPSTILYSPSTCGQQTATVTTNDGSGYTVGLDLISGGVGITSLHNTSGWVATSGTTSTVSDPFSNSITYNNNTFVFTDSLGAQATEGTSAAGASFPWSYTDANGSTQNITLTTSTALTYQPYCNNTGGNTTFVPITSINYPDGTSFGITWDKNTGFTNSYSGLIGSVTLRTGGQISYTYNVGSCTQWYNSSLTRTTPDGTWNYSLTTASNKTTTTVKDPGVNKTVYVFVGSGNLGTATATIPTFTSTVDRYQNTGSVASPSYTGGHISETTYCYNGHNADCSTYVPVYPITQLDIDEYLYTTATPQVQVHMSHDTKLYDSTYGLISSDAKTDEISGQVITTSYVYGTNSGGTCVAISNSKIVDHPCTITTKNGTTWVSESVFTYNSNGATTVKDVWLNSGGTSKLTTNYTPTTQGTYSVIQDPNGQNTNYTFGNCNSLLPTDITTTVNSIAIDNKMTWNCNAGVVTDTTDPNSNEDDTTYDSMNRPSVYTDRLENLTHFYYGTPTLDHTKTTDPLSIDRLTYVDGLGRPTIKQVRQSSSSSNYDTVSHTYGWKDSGNHALTNFQTTTSGSTTSAACTTTLGASCPTVTLTALTNPIAGPYQTTDANSGTVTHAVNSKDFSVTAGPAPSGEHTKGVQTEIDGFGRTTSVCALETSGGTACGQTMGNNGVLTSNSYSFPSDGVSEVQTTRGSQTHTTKADAVGRTTSIQTPEAGTTTSTYDSRAANYCMSYPAYTSTGDLVATNDAATNHVCYWYDGLHRVITIGNNNESSTNPCKQFRYDSTANGHVSAPTGYPSSGANILGRLMEAATTDSCGNTSNLLTDEWFAYNAMGRMTDMWEKTPNSGSTYYHTTVTYDADGTPTSLTIPTFSAIAWGVDGEDRWNSMTYNSTVTIVNATGFTYDAAGKPTNVPIGTGGDKDVLAYDQLEHMTEYTFNVGTKADDGKLTWNSIGSLGKLVINDTITNSTDSQTCAYGYDDVARLTSAATVTGSTCNGPMTYTYDQYDNLTQAGSFSYGCSTCYSSTNNQQTGTPTLTYDSNGNVTYDQSNTYTWNVYDKLAASVSGSTAATCGTSGMCYVYDASGRLVEEQFNGSNSQYVYSPIGRVAKMNGQTGTWAMVQAPGGGYFWQNSGHKFIHPDWIGSARLVAPVGSGTVYNDQAYEPYGQPYNVLGTSFNLFAGDVQDDSGLGLYLTPNRNLPQVSARWLSPDSAHASWNAYSYPTDPNTQTDPSGLCSGAVFNVVCYSEGQGIGDSRTIFPDGLSPVVETQPQFMTTGYNVEDVAYPPGYVPGTSYIENQLDECTNPLCGVPPAMAMAKVVQFPDKPNIAALKAEIARGQDAISMQRDYILQVQDDLQDSLHVLRDMENHLRILQNQLYNLTGGAEGVSLYQPPPPGFFDGFWNLRDAASVGGLALGGIGVMIFSPQLTANENQDTTNHIPTPPPGGWIWLYRCLMGDCYNATK